MKNCIQSQLDLEDDNVLAICRLHARWPPEPTIWSLFRFTCPAQNVGFTWAAYRRRLCGHAGWNVPEMLHGSDGSNTLGVW